VELALIAFAKAWKAKAHMRWLKVKKRRWKKEGMVFTRAARLRCEKVADYVCEIVQYVLEVDSMYIEYEPVLVWHATLCQTMDYPTVSTLAQSLYDMVESMSFRKDPEFEFAVNHLSR
jgi:hypothetical protein